MIKFDKKNYEKNLPDSYYKNESGNIYKILQVEQSPVLEAEQDIKDVLNSLDLNEAKGKTLDLYGEMIGQARGVATDDQYILMIKSKIMQNLSTGDFPSILNSICLMLSCEPSEVIIEESTERCAVKISKLPLETINKAGLSANQTVAAIKRLLPVGVSIDSFLFEGTFEFSNIENEASETAGFADEEQTIGGYLGIVNGEENEPILPI